MTIPGTGLLKGLSVTLRNLTRRSVTAHYPDALPELPPRSRGVIALIEENCTVCMLCARECPAWCIYIDSHKDVVPADADTPGAKDKSRNVLDRFAIDYSICMYCSICVEVCPFDALHWSPEFEYSELDIRDLTHEKDRLREWMWTVPAPSPLDEGAEPAKEIGAAQKAAQLAAQRAQQAQEQTQASAPERTQPRTGEQTEQRARQDTGGESPGEAR